MARRQQPATEFEPRHRILGAIVLVTLGFILFSVVLSEQPQRLDADQKTASAAPDIRVVVTQVPTSGAVTSRPLATPVTVKAVNNPLAPKHLVNTTQSAPTKATKMLVPKPVVVKAAPAKKSVVKSTRPAKKIAAVNHKKWMVQVGTFSDPANARRLKKKLQSQQYRVVTKVVALNSGSAVRVRVGPYSSRQVAINARDRINRKNGIKGVVLARK